MRIRVKRWDICRRTYVMAISRNSRYTPKKKTQLNFTSTDKPCLYTHSEFISLSREIEPLKIQVERREARFSCDAVVGFAIAKNKQNRVKWVFKEIARARLGRKNKRSLGCRTRTKTPANEGSRRFFNNCLQFHDWGSAFTGFFFFKMT